MRNPFGDFQTVPYQKKEIPLNHIVKAKNEVIASILNGYLKIVEAEAKDFVWLTEQSRVLKGIAMMKAKLEDGLPKGLQKEPATA